MSEEHLTDERIQEILDARKLGTGPFLPWHLKDCSACRRRLEEYRRLYEGLAADPGFVLPADFAASVLERVPLRRPALLHGRLFPVALACGAGVLTVAGLAIFADLRPLATGSLRILDSLFLAFRPLAGPFREFFSWFGGSAKLFVYGGLALLGATFVERLLPRMDPQHRH